MMTSGIAIRTADSARAARSVGWVPFAVYLSIVGGCATWGAVQYLGGRSQVAAYMLGGFCLMVATVGFALAPNCRRVLMAQLRVTGFGHRAAWVGLALVPLFVGLNYAYTNLLIGGVFGEYFTIATDNTAVRMQLKLVLLAAVLPAIVEEVAFRGLVQEHLAKGMRAAKAIALTAMVFALAHYAVMSIPYLFLFGCVLGWMRWKTGSLYPPIAAHVAHNLLVLWWI